MAAALTELAIKALIARARDKKRLAKARAFSKLREDRKAMRRAFPDRELPEIDPAAIEEMQVELMDSTPGLRIRAGERSAIWSLSVRLKNGQRTRVTLGGWPGLGIADARKAAHDKKREIEGGVDPNAAKRAEKVEAERAAKSRRTLAEVLEQYEAEKLCHLKRGANAKRALDGKKGLLRDMLDKEPRSITRADIADAVKKHARPTSTNPAGAPIAANRALAYARAFFNWCVSEEIIETNPAEKVKKPGKENQRDRTHSLAELGEIWAAAGTLDYPFGPLYRLLMVVPMRREEIAAMPISELDLGSDDDPTQGVWTLPKERTKRANALRVPLSPLARSIIKEALADPKRPAGASDKDGLWHANPFLFSTGYTPVSGFTKGKRRLDKAIADARAKVATDEASRTGTQDGNAPEPDVMPGWTIHDLRTSFATNASDRLGIDATVADRCLNHVGSATTSKIMRTYNQSELFEPRKAALCAWASLIESEALGRPAGNVVPLRAADAA